MSQYCSLFASGEGSSAQERSLIEAAHIIVGRDKLISEGRGLRLLPQLLPASRLSQGGEELGASRLIQGVCGGQPGMFSPGVLAANGVSYVSPLVRAEQVVQEEPLDGRRYRDRRFGTSAAGNDPQWFPHFQKGPERKEQEQRRAIKKRSSFCGSGQ